MKVLITFCFLNYDGNYSATKIKRHRFTDLPAQAVAKLRIGHSDPDENRGKGLKMLKKRFFTTLRSVQNDKMVNLQHPAAASRLNLPACHPACLSDIDVAGRSVANLTVHHLKHLTYRVE